MKYQAVLFDLDGTLTDTLADLTKAMNAGLRELGKPLRTAEECRRMIGYGVREFARRALPPEDEGLTDMLKTFMVRYYDEHCLEDTRPYPGIPEVLQELRQKEIPTGVISNKNHPQTVKIVRHFFGEDTFQVVCGMMDSIPPKPHPGLLLRALETLSAEPARALYVGDSDIDILTARAAGTEVLGVTWGYRSEEVLRKAGADKVISHPAQIMDLVS